MSVLARYTSAAALARVADEGARVGLILLAVQRTGSAGYGGLLVAALMVPHVLAAPVVGAAADAIRRRRPLYVGGLILYGLALLGAGLAVGTSVPVAVVMVVLAGCIAPLLIGGLSSLLGELAPDDLERAFGLDATSYGLAGIVGPALVALLAGRWGPIWGIAALTVACLASAALVATLPIADRPARVAPRDRQRLLAAVPAIWRRPGLGAVTAATTISQVGMGALALVAVLLAQSRQNTALAGLLLSTMAVGGLVSSLAYARWPIHRWRPEVVVLLCVLVTGAAFALVPVFPATPVTLALFAVAGLVNGPMFCALLAVRDRDAPAGARTQVFTLGAGLKVTAAAAGAAIAAVATGWGAGPLLIGVAGCQLLGAAAGVAILRRRGQLLESRA
jgi:predicted MFS family arabinose efflux permease